MILTEKEAKTKFCPHIRIASYDSRSFEPIGTVNVHTKGADQTYEKCIASRCMMWRTGYGDIGPTGRSGEWQEKIGEGEGYCGLAY